MTKQTWLLSSVNPETESVLFEWALAECKTQGLALKVVVVLPELGHKIFEWFEHEKHHDLKQQQMGLEEQKRKQWLRSAQTAGVEYSIEIRFGKLFYEVVQCAHQHSVQLLLKQAEDIQQSDGLMFQSVDWHLLRKSPVPLLLYRKGSQLPFAKTVVSMDVDIELQPYEISELNQSLLMWAKKLRPNAVQNIVHAWQADVENLMRHWDADLADDSLIQLSEQLYFEHKKAVNLELEASQLNQESSEVFMCKGEPAESIAESVAAQKADLLILGTLARSGLPGLLIGNTAEDLLERVNCSVLTIKPAQFKSPIL